MILVAICFKYPAHGFDIQDIGGNVMEARCMKCKQNREMKDEKEVTMKNGMRAASGVCAHCGTKMFKILGKAK